MSMEVHLEAFEGPLDLLLHLIDKNKVDIYDIPISLITKQYMEYLDEAREADMNIMSEFLVMAATLLDIKCKMLLPKEVNEEGEEEDPRSELVQQLLEYKIYKYMSMELKDMEMDAGRSMFKENTMPEELINIEIPIDYDELLKGISLSDLEKIFKETLKRQEDRKDPIRSKFGKIEKEEVSLEDRTRELVEYSKENKKFSFRDLLAKYKGKLQLVVTFLAVLELIRSDNWKADQKEDGDIIISAA